jgi:hypothetical protein
MAICEFVGCSNTAINMADVRKSYVDLGITNAINLPTVHWCAKHAALAARGTRNFLLKQTGEMRDLPAPVEPVKHYPLPGSREAAARLATIAAELNAPTAAQRAARARLEELHRLQAETAELQKWMQAHQPASQRFILFHFLQRAGCDVTSFNL